MGGFYVIVCLVKSICVDILHYGCSGFFGLFGRVLKVVFPDVSPVSVAGIFRGQQPVFSWALIGVSEIDEAGKLPHRLFYSEWHEPALL